MNKKQLNHNLNTANKDKNDEFYTCYDDIDKELGYYSTFFKDKVILCNCDYPQKSNFVKYFLNNFKKLKLKKLFVSYKDVEKNPIAIIFYLKDDILINKNISLSGNGDFRSKEIINLLEKSDIVISNPPFSLLREYIQQLYTFHKKFLIIGNMNIISNNFVFGKIKDEKLWLGINSVTKFEIPKFINRKNIKHINGKNFAKFGNIVWFTNLINQKRVKKITLTKKYSKDKYSFFDNYLALSIDKVKDIPYDYKGIMGVPISYINKHCPNQFMIVGIDYDVKQGKLNYIINKKWNGKLDRGYKNGKRLYSRIFIKKL